MFQTPEELKNKIRLGEDNLLELKSVRFRGNRISSPSRDALADEMAAFANTREGVIVFGVDDRTRDIEGVPLEKLDILERFVRELCNDSIEPPLQVSLVRLELPDNQGVIQPLLRADIPRSLFVHKSPGGYFHRIGSSKRMLSPQQLAQLFNQRSQLHIMRFDEEPVPGTTIADIEENLWQRFLPAETRENPIVTVKKLGITCTDAEGVERISVGGLLMCSRHSERWLRNSYIEAVRYRGIKRDAHYQINARQITGPLDGQEDTLSPGLPAVQPESSL